MQQTAFKLIDFDARRQQLGKECPAGPADQNRVILARQNNADVDTALCGGTDSMKKIIARHEVGGGHNQVLTRRVGCGEQRLVDQVFRETGA